MPEIARLNDEGILVSIEHCTDEEYKTDPVAKTVVLEPGHDVHKMIKLYRWDFHKNTFVALSAEPLDVAERDTSELVDGILEALEDIDGWAEHVSENVRDKNNRKTPKLRLSQRTKRTIREFRRRNPRKRQPSVETAEITSDMDLVVE